MSLSRRSGPAWLATLAILAGGAAPARAGFTIRDLGVVSPQGTPPGTSGATAINASGQAAGLITVAGGPTQAAASAAGGSLQAVATPPGGSSPSMATAINDSGGVAGSYVDANGHQLGFYTSGNSASSIGPLANNAGVLGTTTVATGINDANQVVGTGNLPGVAGHRAFVVSGGSLTMIAPVGSADASTSPLSNWANGINNKGMIVGTTELVPSGPQEAFFTAGVAGAAIGLGTRNTMGNFQGSTAGTAIDFNGDVVGYGDVGGSDHAFFAAGGGGSLVDLGTLGGSGSSRALGVNDAGLVVGTSGGLAFLYGQSRIYNLASLIAPPALSGWVLTEATGINDADQISGEGYYDGVLHGFELTAIPGQPLFASPAVVPTPPAAPMAVLGLAIARAWSRRRVRGRLRRG